jgi:Reverse transcriptase (RNA-dependent DNA polymerase).
MIRHEVPEAVVDWVEHMLVENNFIVSEGDTTIEGKTDQGCPQGGVLTPILWWLVVNDLLLDLQKEGFQVYGYADDSHISRGELPQYCQGSSD